MSLLVHAGGLAALSVVDVRGAAEAGPSPAWEGFAAADSRSVPSLVMVQPPEPKPPPEPEEREPEPPPPPPPPPPVLMEEPESPLGIDDGAENAAAWKGAKTATENLAPRSQVDQAALAIEPRSGEKIAGEQPSAGGAEQASPATPTAPAAPASEHPAPPVGDQPPQPEPIQPLEEQRTAPQPEEPQPREQQAEPVQPRPVEPGAPEVSAGEVELPAPQLTPEQLREQQLLAQQLMEQQVKILQLLKQQLEAPRPEPAAGDAAASAPRPPSSPAPTQSAASPTTSEARPGLKADEESPAASIEGSMVFRPGEPLAAKGLRVFTVTPRYAITTRMVARPKNAIVNITFGRDGKVKRAVLKDSTGYDDVDKPLLEAVYRWTARGEALNKLPADDPRAGITYSIRFLMESY